MVICPLGTKKKYIIHILTDPQIALSSGMCTISIVNIKKRQILALEISRLHALKKKKIYFYCVRGEKNDTKK